MLHLLFMEIRPITTPSERLLSLDFFRGLIMVLLALESAGLYENLQEASTEGSLIYRALNQFFHHPWNGLRFWDLIQPAFMYMAGVALAYSLNQQAKRGLSWNQSFIKTLRRCALLFFWGVLDYAVRPHGLSFELWDVLTQLSFTTLVAFLIFRWSAALQIITCVGLLFLTEVLYRYTHVPGFDQPFTDQQNFGNYIDLVLMDKINKGGWVAINCIPTAVHTIAGSLTGIWLIKYKNLALKNIITCALIALASGYILDLTGITPIIKRIATTSFTLASLGWCLLAMAAVYWWIDQKNHRNGLRFFTIVGMNSIFIYLFFEIVGSRWFNGYVTALSGGVLQWIHTPQALSAIISSLCIFSLEWGLCYFLYRKGIFFKL